MTTNIKDGGPAFPLQRIGPDFAPGYSGMTLRDYFAAKAMQGFLSGTKWEFDPVGPMPIQLVTDLALSSYQIADAMLKARRA